MASRSDAYQTYAERCRVAAETAVEPVARATFLMLADQWVTLAERIERLDCFDGPLVRPLLD